MVLSEIVHLIIHFVPGSRLQLQFNCMVKVPHLQKMLTKLLFIPTADTFPHKRQHGFGTLIHRTTWDFVGVLTLIKNCPYQTRHSIHFNETGQKYGQLLRHVSC